ncbi:MAG: cell division protein FtsL [Magnetococcales bacterium]|nr:cell division protein FtsL [Magnetococcales bacterium]
MRPYWLLSLVLIALLVVTAAATVASRSWMLTAHRALEAAQKERLQLLDEEQALQVEWVYRTGLNTIERRARKELGMEPPRSDQWRVWRQDDP